MNTCFWTAKLCLLVEKFETGLSFLDTAIEIAENKGKKDLEDLPRDKAKLLLALKRYDEVIHFLTPYINYLRETENPNYRRLGDCSFHMVAAYSNLENIEGEYLWRLHTIDYYLADNTDQDWMEDFCFVLFEKCLDWSDLQKIVHAGKIYLNSIEAVYPNHIMVTHYLGLAFEDLKESEKSILYHKKCIEYAQHHPGEYTDMVETSNKFLVTQLK